MTGRRSARAWRLHWSALLTGLLALAGAAVADPPLIAAAANVQPVLAELAGSFRAETGQVVRLSFGSSGNIARQIAAGAPYEMFLSADEALVRDLARLGRTRDDGVVYAVGRIAMFVPEGSPIAVDASLDGLASALAAGRVRRFVIANPELAPYGRAARQALQHRGLWLSIADKIVQGETIGQTAQFAASGASEGGILALSLVLAPELARRGRHVLIPEAWHEPIRQRMVLLASAGPVAGQFYLYLQGGVAREAFARHGYAAPDTL